MDRQKEHKDQPDWIPSVSSAPTTTPTTTTSAAEKEPDWMSQRRSQYAGEDLEDMLRAVDAQQERLNKLYGFPLYPPLSRSVSSATTTGPSPKGGK
jgi:hypothetical protein